jgi:predicted nucleic acid-binding protein
MSSYHIILKNLIKAIKEGKISKIVGRAIIRKLKKRGFLVSPELLEVVNS